MSRDNISSGELDRLTVIAACLDVEKRILELRHEKREATIVSFMTPKQGRIARWLKLDPITRTRERAEEFADAGDGIMRAEHTWMYGGQLGIAQEIRSLAEASQAPTIRVTREDFSSIKSGWDAVKAAAKPTIAASPSTNKLYPGAACDNCGWVGKRVDLRPGDFSIDEKCPECGSSDTSWLTPEELKEATA